MSFATLTRPLKPPFPSRAKRRRRPARTSSRSASSTADRPKRNPCDTAVERDGAEPAGAVVRHNDTVDEDRSARRDDLGLQPEAVDWRDGCAYPAGADAGSFDPLPLADIAIKAARTGGRSAPRCRSTRKGRGRPLRFMCAMSKSIPRPDMLGSCGTRPRRMSAGPSIRAMSRARSRGSGTGDRLGAKRGVHLRQAGPPR
jgi:hypothetical protein